ncbi:MAG: PaaI family thioesterase [Candidatus Eremiobacteraeota bacterium]|nr:PaaI family thioesterase [Candidatus Eremiobacteraeota bacterium]
MNVDSVELDGLTWLEQLRDGRIDPPPIVVSCGMRLEEVESGRIVFTMSAQPWMSNPTGVVHGGMPATLLDTVLTLAVVSTMPPGKLCQTVHLTVHYVRPIFPNGERIRAEGLAVHVGTTMATSEARAFNHLGKLVAHATATLAILDAERVATRYPATP